MGQINDGESIMDEEARSRIVQGEDPDRFYCPAPGCSRSFAELWRLKVHFRAPPDVRGSGNERGHGTELKFCPKCGKDLNPGKHHMGCAAGKSAPRQAAKRRRNVSSSEKDPESGNQSSHSSLWQRLVESAVQRLRTPTSRGHKHRKKPSKSAKDPSIVSTALSALLPGLTMATTDPMDDTSEFRNISAFVSSAATSMENKATLDHKKDERQSKSLSQRAAALHLWQGDVSNALRVLVENDALTSDFVAFAASTGRDAWIAAARMYADFLERKGEVHLAALYLLQAGDAVDACLTYERHKMHREAAALAQLWLAPDHPVAIRAVEQYGTSLSKAGHEQESSVVLGNPHK